MEIVDEVDMGVRSYTIHVDARGWKSNVVELW